MSKSTPEQTSTPRQTAAEREADRSDQDPSTGAMGGDESPAADTPIGLPAKDDSPLGDSDQHSTAATHPSHPRK